jgi:predicted nuclease with TOPRIM domain
MSKPILDSIRLFDLVRFQRHQLHDEGLITNEEYSALVSGAPGAVSRLESYDEIRSRLDQAKEDVTTLLAEFGELTEPGSRRAALLDEIRRRWGCP